METTGQQKISVYDSSGNAIASGTATLGALVRGLAVRLAGTGNTVTIASGASVTVQGSQAVAVAQAIEGTGYTASSLKPLVVVLEGADLSTNFPTPIFEIGGGLAVSGNAAVLQQDASNYLKTADQNLPAPAVLADATANPTLSKLQSFLMGYNGTTWDRLQVDASKNLKQQLASWIGSTAPTVGQKTMGNSIPITIASDQSALPTTVGGTVDVSDRDVRLLGRLNGNLSTGNSSTTLLGIGAIFTGTFEDVKDYASITISVFTDQASATDGLQFDWSHDGTNVDASTGTTVNISAGRAFSIAPRARYFRVKYTNGGTGQGIFRLGTVYHPTGSGLISRPLDQSMDTENYAQQVRAVVDGFDGTNFQHIASKTGIPALTDIGLVTRGLVYRNPLLGLYYVESGNQTVLASAHAATAGFFWLVNTSSTVKVYIRSIGFVWSGTAATAFPTSPRITVERITFTGTPSGATLTPAKRASTDAANTATLRTASTGMTITAGAVIESFVVGSILTAVGAISVPEEIWQSPDDDGMILLGQNEGIVVRQADAGTTADSRKVVMTIAWEER